MNPAKFLREVRQEASRVTWPTRKETLISSSMVLILAFIAAVFFLAVDNIISLIIKYVFGIGV